MPNQNPKPPRQTKRRPNRSLDDDFEIEVARMRPYRVRLAARFIAALREHRRIWVRVAPAPVARVRIVTATGIDDFIVRPS